MSRNLCNDWKEAILEEASHTKLNKHSEAVVSITHSDKSGSKVFEELRNNNQVFILGHDQVSEKLFLVHHVKDALGGIGSYFKAIACLQGLGTKATSLQLNSELLSDNLDIKYPSVESIWNAGSAQ